MIVLEDTICAVATPPGEGALGIIRLSGPRSLELLRLASRRQRFRPRQQRLCRIVSARGELLDEVLACYQPGPGSYTGEDTVEFYAHGGGRNLRRLIERIVELGARPAEPGEFTRRAFLNGKLDLTQAEGIARIIEARSERALQNAQALHAGRLRERVEALRESLLGLAVELEAAIDFSEEVAPRERSLRCCAEAEAALATLLASYPSGRRLDRGRVGLVGAVNAGKSSLFNRLLGAERALVEAAPGTTRDYLEAEVNWEGYRLELVDSAGLRGAGEGGELERAGLALAAPVLARCDLLIVVQDLTGMTSEELPECLGRVPRLEVGSKADLVERVPGPRLRTSARTGEGIEELRAAILAMLFPSAVEAETLLLTEERQWLKLIRAREELEQAARAIEAELPPEIVTVPLRSATQALSELTGELTSEAVLDEIFSRFCIGK
jgi:tRNA modification GTPase